MTELQFPLAPGIKVSLKCNPGNTLNGDSIVTCVEGSEFAFNIIPSCSPGSIMGITYMMIANVILICSSSCIQDCGN